MKNAIQNPAHTRQKAVSSYITKWFLETKVGVTGWWDGLKIYNTNKGVIVSRSGYNDDETGSNYSIVMAKGTTLSIWIMKQARMKPYLFHLNRKKQLYQRGNHKKEPVVFFEQLFAEVFLGSGDVFLDHLQADAHFLCNNLLLPPLDLTLHQYLPHL